MEREQNSVVYKGKRYKVKKRGGLLTLNLGHKKIKNISEIEGLVELTNLQKLDLEYNRIKEIRNLETLTNLQTLNLQWNQIEVVEGLDNLSNLCTLNLANNRIKIIESFENKEKLKNILLSGNPILKQISGTNLYQKGLNYRRMTEEAKKKYEIEYNYDTFMTITLMPFISVLITTLILVIVVMIIIINTSVKKLSI